MSHEINHVTPHLSASLDMTGWVLLFDIFYFLWFPYSNVSFIKEPVLRSLYTDVHVYGLVFGLKIWIVVLAGFSLFHYLANMAFGLGYKSSLEHS